MEQKKISIKAIVLGALTDIGITIIMGAMYILVLGFILIGVGVGIEHIDGEIQKPIFLVGGLLIGFLGTICGGYVAGTIAKTRKVFHGGIVGCVGMFLSLLSIRDFALWYSLVGMIATIPIGMCGGYLAQKKSQTDGGAKTDTLSVARIKDAPRELMWISFLLIAATIIPLVGFSFRGLHQGIYWVFAFLMNVSLVNDYMYTFFDSVFPIAPAESIVIILKFVVVLCAIGILKRINWIRVFLKWIIGLSVVAFLLIQWHNLGVIKEIWLAGPASFARFLLEWLSACIIPVFFMAYLNMPSTKKHFIKTESKNLSIEEMLKKRAQVFLIVALLLAGMLMLIMFKEAETDHIEFVEGVLVEDIHRGALQQGSVRQIPFKLNDGSQVTMALSQSQYDADYEYQAGDKAILFFRKGKITGRRIFTSYRFLKNEQQQKHN